MKKEVHVDHKSMLPDPSNIVTNVGKDDKKPTACEPKVSAVTPIDIRRRKWVEKVSHVTMVTSLPTVQRCLTYVVV